MTRLLRSLLLAFALAGPAAADVGPRARFRVEPVAAPVRAGDLARVRVRIDLDPGWHTYPPGAQADAEGDGPAPLDVAVADPGRFALDGPVRTSEPAVHYDAGFKMDMRTLEGSAWLDLPLRVRSGAAPGPSRAVLALTYQACDAAHCLPPEEVRLEVPLQVLPGGAGQGTLAFLGLALLAGFGALLTPCVFPMVPVTVSFFAKRAERGRGRALRDALAYGAGIVGTFTGLGVVLALVAGATGLQDLAASPWMNLALALVFVLFALSLFGSLELRPPQALLNRLGARADGNGTAGILLMGLTFSLSSFTCTAPFVGSALVSVARGAWFRPVLGMAAFSLAFATPFVLLAMFPAALQRLPRGGGWMVRLKAVLGFLELGAAMKFLSNADLGWAWGLVTREAFLAAWAACALLACLYLLGVFRLPGDGPEEPVGGLRALAATAFAAAGILCLGGLLGRPLGELEAFLPPAPAAAAPASAAPAKAAEAGWYTDYGAALAEARRTGRPLFVDFTGFTCTNCRWMEANMFPRPAVAARLEHCVKVRLHTDRQAEPFLSNRRMQLAHFDSVELPLYALMTPEEQVLGTASFTRDEGAFLAFLGPAAG